MNSSKAHTRTPLGRAGTTRRRPRPGLRRRSAWTMSLNLTPMIDIVFLLLFFFLVVSRFRVREGMLPAQLPAQAAVVPVEVPRTPIRINFIFDQAAVDYCRVTIDRFNESPMPIALLSGALQKVRAEIPGFDEQTPVHLLADDEVPWDHVVNAYNAALSAGYRKIFFVGSP